MIVLFDEKQQCCGCGACKNVCPKDAIQLCEDQYGYVYPKIDYDLCINCHACEKVCTYQNGYSGNEPLNAYAASSAQKGMLKESSSGGVFSVLARYIIRNGGVVYGAAYDNTFAVNHIRVTEEKDLYLLKGSKYVQSEIGYIYRSIKKDLEDEKIVLFSGTPCQVSGLNGYLGKDYENLYTVDIICHGVPSKKLFLDYLDCCLGKENISSFEFRDKSRGWEEYFLKWKKGYKVKRLHNKLSSYYTYFLNGEIFRENCYTCKYANLSRCSDITIGDYWKIRQAHPELIKNDKWKDYLLLGVSCVLINTFNGERLFDETKKDLVICESRIDDISKFNKHLLEASTHTDLRNQLLNIYEQKGYKAIERHFQSTISRKLKVKSVLKTFIPLKIKSVIKRLL